MPKAPTIETLLKNGSAEWNKLRKLGKVGTDHTGATFAQLFSANTDLSGLGLVGTEWEKCDLSKVSFRDADLSNAYFHGGRLQDCDFRGANLEGATFERLKLLRCDFTGATGLEELELEEVDMDRVSGLDGEEAPPPPPPPAVGITSFTREQRAAQIAATEEATSQAMSELPPFRPQDPPSALLSRQLKKLGNAPLWVLDVPGLKPQLPGRLTPGSSLESLLREAVKARLEGLKPVADQSAVERAQQALRLGNKEAPVAAMYLKEVAQKARFRFAAAKGLREALRVELDVDDLTGQVDPRITGALLELRLAQDTTEPLGEVRRRLAAAQLFTSLLEAGFHPENNWEEAIDATDAAMDLATVATGGDRPMLAEAFATFTALPEEAQTRRLAYLAEAAAHLELLSRMPATTEPAWLHGPEYRECHEQEMELVQSLTAEEIPQKVAELAQSELGVAPGEVPEDSDNDLFLHFQCPQCGKQKLVVQSP